MSGSHVLSMHMPYSLSSSSSSIVISKQIKNTIRTLLVSCAYHFTRALAKARSILMKNARKKLYRLRVKFNMARPAEKETRREKIYLGSFRFHFNWSAPSSTRNLQPFTLAADDPANLHEFSKGYVFCYDPRSDSIISVEAADDVIFGESQLAKYLEWLEGKGRVEERCSNINGANEGPANNMDDVDKLAEIFIAKCHEMFVLEKQESYRRFQEMIAV